MAYYYLYQQNHTPSGSLSPETMASELTPSLLPLLLLSPQQQQQQLTLPIVTPVLPSVTTSLPMTTTAANIEYNQQQQLSTPKLSPFLRHCEETGLFQDLRNIGAKSSLTGPSGSTTTITIPVTTTATIVSTTSTELHTNSSLFGLSSSAILTRMPNPFDETFKQAVLQRQKCDSKFAENLFNDNNDTNGDLNTPFISTTSITNISNNQNNSTLTMEATLPEDMITTAVVAAPITVESMTSNTSTVPQSQQQNLFMASSATESTTKGVLVMMMEQQQQQQHNSIVSLQPKNQHCHHSNEQHQQFIIPTTTNITSGIDTATITFHDQDYNNSNSDRGKNDKAINIENETTMIKQALKQNLLVKRQMQERQKFPLVLETHHNPRQLQLDNLGIDIVTTDVALRNSDDRGQEENQNQQQKNKQELLERNRSAAKRSRMKRKQRWDLLSEENRRLKIENSRLRDILTKFISSGYGDQQKTTALQVQQCQEYLHKAEN